MELCNVLKHCDMNSIKISGIITDKQIILANNIGDRSLDHIDLIKEMEEYIYPYLSKREREMKRNENAHIFLLDLGAYLSFPDEGKISMPQVSMMIDFMTELSKYNRVVADNKKIPIAIYGPVKVKNFFDISELDKNVVSEWKDFYRSIRENDQELIVGDEYISDTDNKYYK